MIGILEPQWQRYLWATSRSLEESHGGFRLHPLRIASSSPRTSRSWPAILRLLHHEAYRLLVTDAVMEADLDFAHAHQDYRYIEVLCGVPDACWPTLCLQKHMAHHLHTRLAVQRRYARLPDDAVDRAASLYWEADRLADDSRWLTHRWERRRAFASAHQLSSMLTERRQDWRKK